MQHSYIANEEMGIIERKDRGGNGCTYKKWDLLINEKLWMRFGYPRYIFLSHIYHSSSYTVPNTFRHWPWQYYRHNIFTRMTSSWTESSIYSEQTSSPHQQAYSSYLLSPPVFSWMSTFLVYLGAFQMWCVMHTQFYWRNYKPFVNRCQPDRCIFFTNCSTEGVQSWHGGNLELRV